MPNFCWAESLGGCSEKISREHLVSRSFFTAPSVRVKGLAWCKLEEKTIGLDSAVAKVLCQHHNSRLSPLDHAAKKFTQVMREFDRLYAERSKSGVADGYRRFSVDGRLLERWMLKTLINTQVGGESIIGQGPGIKGQPTPALVKAAFGEKSIGGSFGMYVASHVNMTMTFAEQVSIAPLLSRDGSEIHGALVDVYGMHFLFNATENPMVLTEIAALGVDWGKCQFEKRFRKFNAKLPNGALSHEIRFKWW